MSDPTRTRREFLADAGGATATIGIVSLTTSTAHARSRRRRPTVAVLGGGIAGLTAAQELAERGFDVTVFERRAWGGKARSIPIAGTGRDGRQPLPGEHGYRVVFGQYQNLTDSMRRIPYGSNPNGVFDNLVPGPQVSLARAGGREDLVVPLGQLDPRPYTPAQLLELLTGLLLQTRLSPQEVALFVHRMGVFFSSCEARRFGQWEQASWWDFVRAEGASADYQELFAVPWTRLLQALRPEQASARAIGRILELIIYGELGFGMTGPFIRVTNCQTNDAWIDPWIALLERRGVQLRLGHTVTRLKFRDGRIAAAETRSPRGRRQIEADWFVCALPVERARRLWTRAILDADPALAKMRDIETRWMNGIQFFLRDATPIVNGPIGYLDSPWALSSVSKAQFWKGRDFAATYGDGHARDCLSVDIGDWDTPGILLGKPARDCTPQQVADEVWEQLKRHLNDGANPKLTDDSLLAWALDPGLVRRGGRFVASEDPLVVPTPGSWHKRPDAATAIPNLLLAADYVRTDFEAQTMEAANEAGRRAVNALLDRAASTSARCEVFQSYQPPEWAALKRLDEDRYGRGQPNVIDASPLRVTDSTASDLARSIAAVAQAART